MKLDMHVNLVLLPFKAVYFFFLAGMACLIPFLPVYMHQLGLSVVETGLIRSLEPCVSFIASPIWGSLADKYSKHKLLLIVSILGSGLLTFSVLFVPASVTPGAGDATHRGRDNFFENHTASQGLGPTWSWNLSCSQPEWTQSSFCSDSDQTNSSWSDVCAEFCDAAVSMREFPSHFGSDVFWSCTFCTSSALQTAKPQSQAKENATLPNTSVAVTQWQPTDEVFLRIFCLQTNVSSDGQKPSQCSRGTSSSNAMHLSMPFMQNFPRNFNECLQWQQCTCSNATSPETPAPHVSNLYVFILVATLILSSKIFLCNVFPLMDSTLMVTLGTRPQDYGKQRLWGAVGWGAFALISGATIDALSKDSTWVNYDPAFYLFISLEALCFVATFFVALPSHKSNKKMMKNLCGLLLQANIVSFILVVCIIGMSLGIIQTYFFLFLEEIHSPHVLMGLTLTINCVSEVPFLFFSGRIIKRITYIGVAYLTLLAYALRFLGYSLISNPWWVLPFELLHGFTYGAFWAACTSFASANAPSGMTTTLQAVMSACHVGVGKGVGTAVGGVIYQEWGSRTLFRVCLIMCLGTAVIYFLLRRFLVEGVEGPLAMYRKFSLVRGDPASADHSRKDSCLSEADTDATCSAMDSQHMQLTITAIDQSKPDSPPVTKTYHTHRPLLHNMQIPNTPDSPDEEDNTSPGSSSLSKLLRMEDRLPAAGQEVLEMREGRPPVVGEESAGYCGEGQEGKQTVV